MRKRIVIELNLQDKIRDWFGGIKSFDQEFPDKNV
jgi:hypothetical protein